MRHPFRSLRISVAAAAVVLIVLSSAYVILRTSTAVGAAEQSAKRVSLAYIVKFGTVPYFINEARGVRSQAQKLGATVTVEDVEQDSNLELTDVTTAIGQGVNGIITVVPNQKLGPAVIAKARTARVPVIALDDPIVDANGAPAPFIGLDASAMGRQVGDELAQLFGKAKLRSGPDVKIASIEDQAAPVCMQRNTAAFEAFKKRVPDFDPANVLHIPYHNDLNSAIDAMAPIVTVHSDVKTWLIYSCNDAGVLGAWRALANNGVSADRVYGVGIGGEYACAEFSKKKLSGFRASFYIDAAKYGAAAVQELYDYASKGTPIPQRRIFPGVFVDSNNYTTVIHC